MKETDTDTSVVWPSWCYSDNILPRNVLKECSEIDKDLYVIKDKSEIEILSNYPSISEIFSNAATSKRQTNIIATPHSKLSEEASSAKSPSISSRSSLLQSRQTIGIGKKMLSERSLLLSGYNNNNTIDSVKKNCDQNNTSTPPQSQQQHNQAAPNQGGVLTITPTSTAAAAAYLYLEKVKNERMSPRVTAAQIDSLKDAIMESSAAAAVAAAMVNNNNSSSVNNNRSNSGGGGGINNCNNISNNLVISQVQSQIGNSVTNNTSDELQSHSLTQSSSQQHHQQQQQNLHQQHQQQQSLHMNSNHVKKERLSPGTNGDHQSTLSRSRSTTPSSFRGVSPQQSMRSSPSETLVPMHNLSTNILNSIHQAASRHSNINVPSTGITNASSGLPTDFSTRNYSDFMRSLAAKYNNTNPNDSSNLRRNTLFETTSNSATATASKKTPTNARKTSYSTSPSTSINKEASITTSSSLPPPPPLTSAAISPSESAHKMTQQNKIAAAVANAAVACGSNVSPYMTSFLTSLPFSPGIFPPLIDMSSTQALITLARAAKETEIHNILSSSQHPKRSATSVSPLPSPSLNIALQQAAQFVSPALLYSTQLQKQQQQQVSRQSSPRLTNISNSTSLTSKKPRSLGEKINVSPLDLSSQQPASKRFKAESTSSQSSGDGLINTTTSTTTITRRASSSTATTSPSPPPINEKSSSVVVGSSTKTEATTTAFTPIKVASSTSAKSSSAPAVSVRQCQAQSEEVNSWTVDDVCAFVGSIDICAEYVKHFRDQCIDGSGLPLLTEDHLVNSLGMKLGPTLKLRSILAKKLGGPCPCVSCVAQVQQVLALQTSGITAAAVSKTAALTNPATTSEHLRGGGIEIDKATIGSSSSGSSSCCNSHLPKDTFSINSSINCNSSNNNNYSSSSSHVNKNESTTITTATSSNTNAIATNSNTTNFCNSEDNTDARSNSSNCNINIGNFSPTQQSHNNCNSSSNNSNNSNNNNATNNRHDNADSSS